MPNGTTNVFDDPAANRIVMSAMELPEGGGPMFAPFFDIDGNTATKCIAHLEKKYPGFALVVSDVGIALDRSKIVLGERRSTILKDVYYQTILAGEICIENETLAHLL